MKQLINHVVFWAVSLACNFHPAMAANQPREALLIGNGAYTSQRVLPNPKNDVQAMDRLLQDAGFHTVVVRDAKKPEMERAIKDFGKRLKAGKNTVALLYYSGHGAQIEDANYLLPVDFQYERELDIKNEAVAMSMALEEMQYAGSVMNLIVLDACRTNPNLQSKRSIGRSSSAPSGLAAIVNPPKGVFIAYATMAGGVADDGQQGGLSPYTEALTSSAREPGLKLEDVFKHARDKVMTATADAQRPGEYSMITGDFYFFNGPNVNVVEQILSGPDPEVEMWSLVKGTSDTADVDRFLQKYPSGKYTDSARLLRDQLSRRNKVAATASMVVTSAVDKPGTVIGGGGTTPAKTYSDPTTRMEFVYVPGGCFQMGDTFGDGESDEKPVHEVCVDGFYIGKYEVMQGEYTKIVGSNPSYFKKGDRYPVEQVSWNDAQAFIKSLSSKSDKLYRLPTEAEWEYAARSGGKSEKYSGSDAPDGIAWYITNSGSATHQVGTKSANRLELYDMSGNIWEWCSDRYDKNYYGSSPRQNPAGPTSGTRRVIRGGGWGITPGGMRSAFRYWNSPDYRLNHLGFRLLLQVSVPGR